MAIRLDPKNVDAYRSRAWASLKLGRFDQSIADYSEVIRLGAPDRQVYNNRGWAYLQLKQYDNAIADYTAAIRLDPTAPGLFLDRGRAWQGKRDYAKAEADFRRGRAASIRTYANNRDIKWLKSWPKLRDADLHPVSFPGFDDRL